MQLDVIPQARRNSLWEPAEPRLEPIAATPDAQDRRMLSVAQLAHEAGDPEMYQTVLDIQSAAMAKRLKEMLDYTTLYQADVVVLPEYAVPVACLAVLLEHSEGRAIVAGLGRIRNAEDVAMLQAAAAPTLASEELEERNVSVVIQDYRISHVVTKGNRAGGEDIAEGTGPVVATLQVGNREIRLGVAVCLDFLRDEDKLRESGAQIVCIPAYTREVKPFFPDAPRDHIRLFANCALHGGSTIIASGLTENPLTDKIGVRPIRAGYEAITLIEFDRYPERPTSLKTPRNRLVLRSEIIESASESHSLLGRLDTVLNRHGGGGQEAVAQLASDARRLSAERGPFAEGLNELLLSSQQRLNDKSLIMLAQSHLVVAAGNRPADIRERQASYVWQQLGALRLSKPETPLGTALDLYMPSRTVPRPIFDASDYAGRVLRRFIEVRDLPSLTDRYALDDQHLVLPDREMTGWIGQVVDLWRRQAQNSVPQFAEVCERFLAADEQLRREARYQDAGWWREHIRAARLGPLSGSAAQTPVTAPSEHVMPQLPGTVTASQLADRVVIRWTAPSAEAAVFIVERLAGQGVGLLRLSTRVAVVEDRQPPAGRELVYRIRVQYPDSGLESQEMLTSVVFTPPVAEPVATQVGQTGVKVQWQAIAGLHETKVWRISSGAPLAETPIPSRRDGFDDLHPPIGLLVYRVLPVYRDPGSGMTYQGTPRDVEVQVTVKPPVPRLTASQAAEQGVSAIVVKWDELPLGASLLLRRAMIEPPGTAGDSFTFEQARAVGEPVAGGEGLTGTNARVIVPAGRWMLVPFAVAGDQAVRGPAITVDFVPAVTSLEAPRNGADVLVSWHWPDNLRMAHVVWQDSDGESAREVTLSEYQRFGGVRFKSSEAAEVRVTGVIRDRAEVLVSAPATVRVEAQPPTLSYHVHRVWPWQVNRVPPWKPHGPHWWCATRRVVLIADLPCGGLTVEIYVSSGDGKVRVYTLQNLTLDHSGHEVMVTLRDLGTRGQPRYLSCKAFSASGQIRVDDFISTGREIRPCFM